MPHPSFDFSYCLVVYGQQKADGEFRRYRIMGNRHIGKLVLHFLEVGVLAEKQAYPHEEKKQSKQGDFLRGHGQLLPPSHFYIDF